MQYIIITPAYNEEANIAKTIESVITQTIRPVLWVIVDDGSNDKTGEIIQSYSSNNSWIKYHKRIRDINNSYYASNVYAIYDGYELVKNLDFKYIAILDADIELPENYYEKIFESFSKIKHLGIASGHCMDLIDGKLVRGIYDWRSVPKNIMVIDKKCYEDIQGFIPLKYAGEDTCACYMARMKGWKTYATTDIMVTHNKPLGGRLSNKVLKIRFIQGLSEYYLATHPLFMLLKSIKRTIKEPPYLIGGIARMFGYIYGHITMKKRQIPKELISFIHKEQLKRIICFNSKPKI